MGEFPAIDAIAACDAKPARKPFEPVTGVAAGGYGRLAKLCRAFTIKRDRSTTFMISRTAYDALLKYGETVDGSVGTMSGLVVDYLARHGRFEAVLAEAIAEMEGRS